MVERFKLAHEEVVGIIKFFSIHQLEYWIDMTSIDAMSLFIVRLGTRKATGWSEVDDGFGWLGSGDRG